MAFSMTKAGVLLDPWSYCCIYLLQFSTYFVTIVLFVIRKKHQLSCILKLRNECLGVRKLMKA